MVGSGHQTSTRSAAIRISATRGTRNCRPTRTTGNPDRPPPYPPILTRPVCEGSTTPQHGGGVICGQEVRQAI